MAALLLDFVSLAGMELRCHPGAPKGPWLTLIVILPLEDSENRAEKQCVLRIGESSDLKLKKDSSTKV